MTTGPEFSRPGDPPTDFEVRLLQAAAGDSDWLQVSRQLMASLGPHAGAAALLVVLDTLGTEKVHVPCRVTLFRGLYRPIRNAEILDLLDAGKPAAEVGKDVGVSVRRVRQIRKRAGRQRRGGRVCSRT